MNEDYFSYFRERRDNLWIKFATDVNTSADNIISLLIFIQILPLSFINAKLWKQDHEAHLEKEEIDLITELDIINEKIDRYYGLTKQTRTPEEMLTFILEKIKEVLTDLNSSHTEFEGAVKKALNKASVPDKADDFDEENL